MEKKKTSATKAQTASGRSPYRKAFQHQSIELRERNKELQCLFSMSEIEKRDDLSLEKIFRSIVGIFPPAWQYPDYTCARIIYEEQIFSTDNFIDSEWKQSCDIIVKGEKAGVFDVCYLKELPDADEGPFLQNERLLINSMTERLGRIIEYKQSEFELETSNKMLAIINSSTDLHDLMKSLLRFMKELSGCDATGIRLRDGDDFPYYETSGFSEDFVKAETHLCVDDLNGQLLRDEVGKPVLECMCGNIICGRFDPSLPFFTDFGSFISNNTSKLLASTTEEERQARTRNRCNGEGYESVFLIPLRSGDETFGLIQFNDCREDHFSPQFVHQAEHLAADVAIALAQRKAETALHKSEEHYRLLADNVYDVVWIRDLDFKLTYISPSTERQSGFSVEEKMRQLLDESVTSDSAATISQVLNEEIAFEKESKSDPARSRTIELEMFRKDGTTYPVETTVSFLLDDADKVTGFIGINRDITDRKQAEKERKKLQEQLAQAQRMESVGRLAGGVAHDFNNMLNVITLNTEMLLNSSELTETHRSGLTEILSAAKRSADLTGQLLAFAREQTVAPKVLDLNNTVDSMIKMLHRLISEDIDLIWMPGKDIEPVKMDPSQIDQILANLCVNARDAIDHKVGRIAIETRNVSIDKEYSAAHESIVPGGYVMLSVSDDGSGMNEETRTNIFEPFYTTKEVGEGTGLGMSTVYGIVKQNSGFINIDSEPNQGTTVKIFLPRHAGKYRKLREEGEAQKITYGTETILLVEDEPAILMVTKKILEGCGYKVIAAPTPGEATRMAGEHADRIDLLITDVVLPEMNGQDLAKQILSKYPDMKHLFMSGYPSDVIAHQGVLDPGVNFIQKPFTLNKLNLKIRDTLDSK